MPVLDFKEIAQAKGGGERSDNFELFARDFFVYKGLKIIEEPNRGADGGKDLIVEETRFGTVGCSTFRWLVSCKHYAHSGKSVNHEIESNIRDRVEKEDCHGFIAFYSTLPSASLHDVLNKLNKIEVQVYDYEKIEMELLKSVDGKNIAKRYFPQSFREYEKESADVVPLFSEKPSLQCTICGSELLDKEASGIVTFWGFLGESDFVKNYNAVRCVCKGKCDTLLARRMRTVDIYDMGWDDIPDIMIPMVYLKWLMATMNNLRDGSACYTDKAFEEYKEFLMQMYQSVIRKLTDEEKETLERLMRIPSVLGGMGYTDE